MKTIKSILLLLLGTGAICLAQNRVTYITGNIGNARIQDSLLLILHGPFYEYAHSPEFQATQVYHTMPDAKGGFKFAVATANSPFHVSLQTKGDTKAIIDNYLIEASDSINISFDKQIPHFTGRGAGLFEAQYSTEMLDKDAVTLKANTDEYFRQNKMIWLQKQDAVLNEQLKLLSTFQTKLSASAYSIVRADIIGFNRYFVYAPIATTPQLFANRKMADSDLQALCNELAGRQPYLEQSDRGALSPKYINYLFQKLKVDIKYQRFSNDIDVRLDYNFFPAINKEYKGILRDKLLALWLKEVASLNKLHPEYLDSALSVMQTPAFTAMANELKTTFGKGQPVTDFGFKDARGNTVHLADFKGKVVYIDLWFTGCTGCLAVAAGLPDVEKSFENRQDVVFVSISIDKDKKTWLKSIDKNTATSTHYRHYTTSTAKYLYTAGTGSNNPFIQKYVPDAAYPSLMIIGKDGRIFSSTPARPVNAANKAKLIGQLKSAAAL